jgi:hypothetical protein
MEPVAESLTALVSDFYDRHRQLPEEKAVGRLSPSGWTLKEIIGHLIDSASNNHQRITRLQLAPELQFPSYENEKWLAAEKWNRLAWTEILDLFKQYNLFLAHLIRNADPNRLKNRWFGRDRSGERIFSLEEMIADYLKHLKEHLAQFEAQEKEIMK